MEAMMTEFLLALIGAIANYNIAINDEYVNDGKRYFVFVKVYGTGWTAIASTLYSAAVPDVIKTAKSREDGYMVAVLKGSDIALFKMDEDDAWLPCEHIVVGA